MSYRHKLLPWCIIRSLSKGSEAELSPRESRLIIRLRHHSDAQAHLQILRANNPTASYEIIFDVMPEPLDSAVPQEALLCNAYRY